MDKVWRWSRDSVGDEKLSAPISWIQYVQRSAPCAAAVGFLRRRRESDCYIIWEMWRQHWFRIFEQCSIRTNPMPIVSFTAPHMQMSATKIFHCRSGLLKLEMRRYSCRNCLALASTFIPFYETKAISNGFYDASAWHVISVRHVGTRTESKLNVDMKL